MVSSAAAPPKFEPPDLETEDGGRRRQFADVEQRHEQALTPLTLLALAFPIGAIVGAIVGASRNRTREGAILGFVLGFVGVVIVVCMDPKPAAGSPLFAAPAGG